MEGTLTLYAKVLGATLKAVGDVTTESPLLFGKYQLLERVARGGMAEVFKAKSYGVEGFEKLVVLKRILPELAQNQQFVDMFLSEARLSVALSHANIVQVFDLGREEDTYFIAMEYVVGMDFAQCLRSCRKSDTKVPVELAVYVAGEVARALDYAHRRRDAQGRSLGIVHRDISPQNVLLSFEGEVKVVDFGIAKARTTIEEQGTVKGKYAYMAPEQAGGTPLDGRADVYALGVTLYEALTGGNPFVSDSPFETVRKVQAGEWTPLREKNPAIPVDLARIVETAMKPRAEERHASAARMYEELAGYLYTTGKRVGPHDLSEWLQSIRGTVPVRDEGKKIQEALTEESRPSGSVPQPVSTGKGARHTESATGRSNTGIGGLRMERRDATFMAVELTVSHTLAGARPTMDKIIAPALRHGATLHAQGDGWALMMFGARELDGREIETATRCALKIHSAAMRSIAGVEVGIGVHAARVHVNAQGALVADERLAVAMEAVRSLAHKARSRVMVGAFVARTLGEGFELSAPEGEHRVVLSERTGRAGTWRKIVGRKEAFKRFGETLAAAANAGLQLVMLEGEAGIGKSRTLEEVLYRLRRMNHEVNWYTATCLTTERQEPLSALRAMLRAVLGIDEADAEGVMREKARRLRELGLNPEEMLAVGAVLGVVSVSVESVDKGSRPLRNAFAKIVQRLSQDKITVMHFDAAENMDSASEEAIGEVIADASRARAVVIVAQRPGRAFAWRDWPGAIHESLGPLAEDEATWLVAMRLGVAGDLPGELADDLWSKSGGVPLHIEEFLKALIERGAVTVTDGKVAYKRPTGTLEVPRTLRGIVTNRVASLSSSERWVLQSASVIGGRFAVAALETVSGLSGEEIERALAGLAERGLLHAQPGGEYAFAYELLREVMYESIPVDARRAAHDAVAEALEAQEPERVEEHAERLARHHQEAGRPARAVHYLERAAMRQRAEQTYSAAASTLMRALDLLETTPNGLTADRVRLLNELGEVALLSGVKDGLIERLIEGARYARTHGEAAGAARVLGIVGRIEARRGRMKESVAAHEEALTALAGIMDQGLRVSLVSSLGTVLLARGDVALARKQLLEAVKLSVGTGLERERAMALTAMARCQSAGGDHELAIASLDRVADLPREALDAALLREVERTRAVVLVAAGEFANALEVCGRVVEIARGGGEVSEVCAALCLQGEVALRAKDERRAFAAFVEARESAEEHGVARWSMRAGVFLAALDAHALGRAADKAKVDEELERFVGSPWASDLLPVRYGLGLLAQTAGDLDDARGFLEAALAMAKRSGQAPWMEDCEKALDSVSKSAPRARPAGR